jgi:hypothetical protein
MKPGPLPLLVEKSVISHISLHSALDRVMKFMEGQSLINQNFDITVRSEGHVRTVTVELRDATSTNRQDRASPNR